MIDGLIRLSEGGDLSGLRRRGLTFDRLVRDHPHGAVLASMRAEGVRERRHPPRWANAAKFTTGDSQKKWSD